MSTEVAQVQGLKPAVERFRAAKLARDQRAVENSTSKYQLDDLRYDTGKAAGLEWANERCLDESTLRDIASMRHSAVKSDHDRHRNNMRRNAMADDMEGWAIRLGREVGRDDKDVLNRHFADGFIAGACEFLDSIEDDLKA